MRCSLNRPGGPGKVHVGHVYLEVKNLINLQSEKKEYRINHVQSPVLL